MRFNKTTKRSFLYILIALLFSACGKGEISKATSLPSPAPSPTASGPRELTVCTAEEPESLYLYGDSSDAAQSIRQAIYDGPFDTQDGQSVGVIFTSTPSFENGGARIEPILVQSGDLIQDAAGDISQLFVGQSVKPSGCRSGDCAIAYTGEELYLDQMIVTYNLNPNLAWADGTPLTAGDSVFSSRIASSADTPGSENAFAYTAEYVALDENTVEWRGIAGHLDPNYLRNFWTPLPFHKLGNYAAAELLALQEANRTPLGWGAYTVDSWKEGESIVLSRNPYYWRAKEELPYFSKLLIRFVGNGPLSNIQALLEGECDVLLPSSGVGAEGERLKELQDKDQVQVYIGEAGSWFHLDFGIQPYVYDDGHNQYNERPNFFSNTLMRQAFAQCVDRQAVSENFSMAEGNIASSYVSPFNAQNNSEVQQYAFDPEAANALLDSLGWILGEEGVRVAENVAEVLPGTKLSMRFHTADDGESLAIAALIRSSLDDCGIEINIISGTADFIFSPGPEGPLFGRNFDLALFAWPLSEQPACYLYLSEAIPGADPGLHPYAWGGWNLSGWNNAEYDAACQAAMRSLPGEAAYAEQHSIAQSIFTNELPALPLFVAQQVAVSRPDFCGFRMDKGGILQSIEEFGFADWCE